MSKQTAGSLAARAQRCMFGEKLAWVPREPEHAGSAGIGCFINLLCFLHIDTCYLFLCVWDSERLKVLFRGKSSKLLLCSCSSYFWAYVVHFSQNSV